MTRWSGRNFEPKFSNIPRKWGGGLYTCWKLTIWCIACFLGVICTNTKPVWFKIWEIMLSVCTFYFCYKIYWTFGHVLILVNFFFCIYSIEYGSWCSLAFVLIWLTYTAIYSVLFRIFANDFLLFSTNAWFASICIWYCLYFDLVHACIRLSLWIWCNLHLIFFKYIYLHFVHFCLMRDIL